jgi:hypothetical protein
MTAYSALFNEDITDFNAYEKEFYEWQKSLTDE